MSYHALQMIDGFDIQCRNWRSGIWLLVLLSSAGCTGARDAARTASTALTTIPGDDILLVDLSVLAGIAK